MDVFLVPVGADRYELYCEVPDDAEAPAGDERRGVFGRLYDRFRATLAAAERERRRREAHDSRSSSARERRRLARRLKDRAFRWLAERIAEQRLLWHLRKQDAASLVYPADMEETSAITLLRARLAADAERHLRWLVIDGAGMLLFGVVLLPIPGPNVIGYYFAFRVVGHYLSRRGAVHGLSRTAWTAEASAPLAELRPLARVPAEERRSRLQEIALRLQLEDLPSFFERTAIST
jgi:hypothetical protein